LKTLICTSPKTHCISITKKTAILRVEKVDKNYSVVEGTIKDEFP
jgi:hypothetical protein